MPLNRSLLLAAALSLSILSTPAFASPSKCDALVGNLISNCGFETGSFSSWTQGGDKTFTFVAPPVPANYFVNSGSYSAGLGPFGIGTLTSSAFSDVVGKSYTLSFFLYGDMGTTGIFSASIDGATVFPAISDTIAAFQQYTTTFIGTGGSANTLQFSFSDPGGVNGYMFLDDVSVTATTPEPSSLALMGTGVLGLVAMGRRKFFKA